MGVIEFYFSSIIGIILFILSLALYFLPTIVAVVRKKRNALAIFLLNLFLGITFIGWVVALVWSATRD
jgi:hypothetical protein